MVANQGLLEYRRQADRPLRVLAMGFRGFPNVQGGIERHAEELYGALVGLGCEVEAIVRSPHMALKVPHEWNGVQMTPIWSPPGTGVEAAVHSFLAVLYAIRRRPDILHVHAVGPALFVPLARLFGLRVVVTTHGSDYAREKWGVVARAVLRLGERLGMRFSTRSIAITKTIASDMAEQYGKPLAVIPNGVRLSAPVRSVETLEQLGLQPGRYVVCIARVVPEKRQLDLIDAFARASLPRGWKLAIVGAADAGSEYANKVAALASVTPGVVLAGFQSGEALTQLYQNAGLYVLPSSHEGLPIGLLEALSFSLPVLASDIAANREVGLDESTYFPLGDIDHLAERMRQIAQTPPALGERQALAKRIIQRYDWEKVAERTLEVYRSALAVPPSSRVVDDELAAAGVSVRMRPAKTS
jgi:glycosyltransferase involved in cell wall biosynthesis